MSAPKYHYSCHSPEGGESISNPRVASRIISLEGIVTERKIERKKIGVVLGGGAARGLAHIGVLEALEQEGIPIDMIAGTSIGAIVGAFYAYTKDIQLMKTLAVEIGKRRLRLFTDLTVPRTGILRWNWVEKRLKGIIGGVRFEDLKIPFCCVAADIDNGEEVVLKDGLVWEAARASATVPVALSIKPWRNRYLVDGGIVNPVPVRAVKEMGADIIIAVNVLRDTVNIEKKLGKAKEPTLFNIMIKSIYIYSYRIVNSSMAGADVIIEPEMAGIGFADFHRAEECIRRGAHAVRIHALPEIKRVLSSS